MYQGTNEIEVCYSVLSLLILAFLHQTQRRAEQTSALLKDKAGNIPFFLYCQPNNVLVHMSGFSDFHNLFVALIPKPIGSK